MRFRMGDTVITKQGATGEVFESIGGRLRVQWSNGYISRVWNPNELRYTGHNETIDELMDRLELERLLDE